MIFLFTYRECPKCDEAKKKFKEQGKEYLEYVANSDGTVDIPSGGARENLYHAWAMAKANDVDTHDYPWAYDSETGLVWSITKKQEEENTGF